MKGWGWEGIICVYTVYLYNILSIYIYIYIWDIYIYIHISFFTGRWHFFYKDDLSQDFVSSDSNILNIEFPSPEFTIKRNAHPQKTRVGHKSYLNGWGFCSPWNWRLMPESVGHLKFRKFHLPTIGMFRGLKLAALGFLGSEIRVPFLVAQKIPGGDPGRSIWYGGQCRTWGCPFFGKLRMFCKLSPNEKKKGTFLVLVGFKKNSSSHNDGF